jgi:hypothetical protein
MAQGVGVRKVLGRGQLAELDAPDARGQKTRTPLS